MEKFFHQNFPKNEFIQRMKFNLATEKKSYTLRFSVIWNFFSHSLPFMNKA